MSYVLQAIITDRDTQIASVLPNVKAIELPQQKILIPVNKDVRAKDQSQFLVVASSDKVTLRLEPIWVWVNKKSGEFFIFYHWGH